MIHPSTQIQYLDIKTGEAKYKSVEEFYQEYCHKATVAWKSKVFDISLIDFSKDDLLKITDSFGWTDILSIAKIPFMHEIDSWYKIDGGDKSILVSSCEYVPTYNIRCPKIGFHGEVKYNYTLKTPNEIKADDYLRLYRGKDNNGSIIEFADSITSKPIDDKYDYGFSIMTKSRFFNANRIHMFGHYVKNSNDTSGYK